MIPLRRNISSLNLLATFEAAARHGSFTLAAAELGVTQAAVSQQIKLLEAELNTALFMRAHRRVVLTGAGQALAATVCTAFMQMSEMIETVRRPITADTVAIGVTLAFSQFWLLPRLPDFRARHPEVKLRLVADDATTDLRRDRLDMAVRYGKPPFDDATVLASRADHAFPVCSPILLDRLGLTAETADIVRLPLISSDLVNPTWITWRSWARALTNGAALARASDQSKLRFNHYTDTVQAALNGEGVALGWAMLLSELLEDGRLVRIGQAAMTPEECHHIVIPARRTPSAACQTFLAWLTGQFAAAG